MISASRFSHGPGLEAFVTTSLVQLICRMTKLCWYEEDLYRKIVDDASQLLEKGAAGQPGLYLLGLKLLSMLVSEMNQPTPGRTLTQHRKIAVAFRDQSLLKTFQLSLTALKQLQSTSAAGTKLREQVKDLVLCSPEHCPSKCPACCLSCNLFSIRPIELKLTAGHCPCFGMLILRLCGHIK